MLFAGHMQLSGLLLTFAMKAVICSVFAVYCMTSIGFGAGRVYIGGRTLTCWPR